MSHCHQKSRSSSCQGASKDETTDEKAEEARNLALESVEALEDGDTEEARFLAAEAKQIDKKAAEAVLNTETDKDE